MQNSKALWASLIAGSVAAISFIGGVAGNLLANDLQTHLAANRPLIWVTCGIAFVVAVVAAVVAVRRNDRAPVSGAAAQKTVTVNANAERSVAISDKVENSTIVTGDANIVSRPAGDAVGRDKITYNIQQAASVAVNSLHQLRAPVGDFVGREQEIETLTNALRRDSKACISGINGMGGIGKTELALFVAERLTNDYPDAQLFINLQGADPNPHSPEQVMEICIRAFLGPKAKLPEDLDQLSQLYRNQLNGKRALLLLDNAADDKQIYPLLPPSGCAMLVTSREAISLPGIKPLTLNPLPDEKARELLLEIAPHAQPAAEQICKLCGYLPLAIRAAGSLLAISSDLGPVDYAAQLQDERYRLEHIGARGVEMGVTASFNLSYQRLAPEAARVFRLLSLFPGTFNAFAAEVVCDDTGHARLSDLVRRSLVLYDASTKRYRLHDLARLFADAKLKASERSAGEKRFATHYKDVLAAAKELYKQGGEALSHGLALFDLEWSNIQAGHAWIAAQDIKNKDVARLGMAYPEAGVYVLYLRQHSRERIRWLEIALAAARRLKDRAGEGRALGNLGVAYSDLGEIKRAIQVYEQRLVIARELGNRQGEGTALGNLGIAYADLGDTKRAIQFFEQALLIAREVGHRLDEGNTLGNLGLAYAALGQTEGAIQFYEQQLLIVREIGDRLGEGNALGNLGLAYADIGETKRALQLYEETLLIARELGDRRGEGTALWNMSLALNQLGQRAQAIEHAQQSSTIFEQIEDPDAAKVREQLAEWRKS